MVCDFVQLCRWIVFVVALATTAQGSAVQGKRPAVPLEPVAAILDAFRTYIVVALGEGSHGGARNR
jgi:hypothetical protein